MERVSAKGTRSHTAFETNIKTHEKTLAIAPRREVVLLLFLPLFIGVLILFALTCTNLSAKLDAGWCRKHQLGLKSSMAPLVGFINGSSRIGFFDTDEACALFAAAMRLLAV